MNLVRRPAFTRGLLVGGAVLAGLVLDGALNPGHVFAGYSVCRTDPIVQLSNGKTLQITSTITDSPSDIRSVVYTAHIPKGVGVNHITYTGGQVAGKESLTVFADNAAGTYTTSTTATTGLAGAPVTATTTVSASRSSVSKSATGVSGKTLTIKVIAP